LGFQHSGVPAQRTRAAAGREIRADRSGENVAVHGGSGSRRRTGSDEGTPGAHDSFYRGDIARAIVEFQEQEGGYLSMDDLAEYHSAIEPVVRRTGAVTSC